MRENKVCLDVELDEWSERNIEKLTVPKMILQPAPFTLAFSAHME